MQVYDHLAEDTETDYDDILHPDATKNLALVLMAALILIAAAVWIISKMGYYNPN
jgi:hypothetical protein